MKRNPLRKRQKVQEQLDGRPNIRFFGWGNYGTAFVAMRDDEVSRIQESRLHVRPVSKTVFVIGVNERATRNAFADYCGGDNRDVRAAVVKWNSI